MQGWIFPFRSRTFVLLTASFVIISLLVLFEATQSFDQNVIDSISNKEKNSYLDLLMQSITESGDVFYMLIFGIVLMLIKKTRRVGITLMILIVVSTILTGYIKCGVDRDRPDPEYVGVEFPVDVSRDTFALFCEGGFNASYPSGHAARSVIFAIVLGYALSERLPRGAYLLFTYPVLVSLSRVYVLHHYPMDVIGGTVLGILLAGILSQKTKLYKIFEKSKS